LQAISSVQLGPGEIMKIGAVAGSGKSTALREYAGAHPQPTLSLAHSTAVQEDQEAKFAAAGLAHVTVLTLDALAFQATMPLHDGEVASTLLVRSEHVDFQSDAVAMTRAELQLYIPQSVHGWLSACYQRSLPYVSVD